MLMPSAIDNFNSLHYEDRLELLNEYGVRVVTYMDGVCSVAIWELTNEYVRVFTNPRVNQNKPTLITMLTYKQLTDVVTKLNIDIKHLSNGRRNR